MIANEVPLPRSIRESYRQLENCVKDLRAEGGTALGPALYLSVKLAGRVPGSRVVLCTDGCANAGLGKIENSNGERGMMGPDFYPFLGEMAKKLGVVVNVISFKGCKSLAIYAVTHETLIGI